jgi:hypothetical protein
MAQIRGVFPFPFTGPALQGVPGELMLVPGQRYILAAGEYIITTGSQTVLQWWDPNNALWRNYAGPETTWQGDSDGTNYSLVNLSGCTVGGSITNAGSGGTNGIGPVQTGSTVSFGAPAAGGVTATATGYVVVGGTVPAPTVTQGGSGFLVPPLVVCDPPPSGGVQATFTSAISAAGVITGVTQVNPGAGYTSIPNFYIVPQPFYYQGAPRWPSDVPAGQPGSVITYPAPGLINPANVWAGSPYQANIQTGTTGALLTGVALTGSGTLTAIVMTNFGYGYTGTTLPAITFAGTSLGAAAATAIMSYCANVAVGSALTGASGTVYSVGAPAITTLGIIASTNNNNTFVPRPIRGKVTNATGPVFTVEDPGFGIQSAGTGVTIGGGPLTVVGNIPAANLGGVNDVSIVQAVVQ